MATSTVSPLAEAYAALDALSDDDLVRFHREVCRRAAKVYEPRYRAIWELNFRQAMARRDTRFVPGLSVMDNIKRSMSLKAS
jgi:hypothetical protein